GSASEGVQNRQTPSSVCMRSQLKYHAEPQRATGWGHAIDVAEPVNRQSAAGAGAIVAPSKSMNHALGPVRARAGQLENDATTTLARPTPTGSAVPMTITLDLLLVSV